MQLKHAESAGMTPQCTESASADKYRDGQN